jgi:P4 family phage/plasmid primase-like protien
MENGKNPKKIKISNLDDFLELFKYDKTKQNRPTHARIPCKHLNIKGGAYYIPSEYLDKYFKLYNKKVFRNKLKDYLVETQDRENGGPILIDFDFKFDKSIEKRQWEQEHDQDTIELITEKISLMCNFDEGDKYKIYVFKKKNMKEENDYVKDGVHYYIGLNMSHQGQMHLRDLVLQDIDEQIFEDLDLVNQKQDIYDNHITNGGGQWQIYGSRKSPNHEAYALTSVYECEYSEDNENFSQKTLYKEEYPELKNRVKIFSTRNKEWPEASYKESIIKLLESKKKKPQNATHTTTNLQENKMIINFNMFLQKDMIRSLKNEAELDNTINCMINSVNHMNHIIKQAHQYTMILNEDYYDSYDKWLKVGWVLKLTDPILILTWLKFSLKSDKCSWNDIRARISDWHKMTPNGTLTVASLIYWAKQCNEQEADKIHQDSLQYYINRCLKSKSYDANKHAIAEWDVGMVAKQIFGQQYICTDIKNNRWFEFMNHRWIKSDSGTTLRTALSQVLSRIFSDEERKVTAQIKNKNYEVGQEKEIMQKAAIFNKIAITLRKTTEKNNVMRECRDIFYDKNLLNNLDENPYIVCFNNGIYDLQENEFRKGRPEDYVSLCTNIDYVEIDENNEKHNEINALIDEFMEKIFPNNELRNYMWTHLASGFVGHNKNQTFNIYTGCGRNGKSKIVELMEMVLGDYKASCPITLITSKRSSIGASSAEIAKLKGKRYVVMQEPSKGDVINEGIMKEITGDDVIEARELYSNPIQFRPMFTFACCTNNLFSIKSNDDGTWRRIRKVPFEAKFIKEGDKDWPPSDVPEDKEFECDLDLGNKLKDWKVIFASRLINIAVKSLGKVKDCEAVMTASNDYRNSQDYLMRFYNEKITEGKPSDKISKSNILIEFKEWWRQENPSEKVPKADELTEFLTMKCGNYKKRGWWGWKIVYDMYEDE